MRIKSKRDIVSSMLIFSTLYMFISDNEWYGVNRIKDIVKEEVTRDKVGDDIEKGNVVAIEGLSEFFAKINENKNNMVEENDKVELRVLHELDKKTINKSIYMNIISIDYIFQLLPNVFLDMATFTQ